MEGVKAKDSNRISEAKVALAALVKRLVAEVYTVEEQQEGESWWGLRVRATSTFLYCLIRCPHV